MVEVLIPLIVFGTVFGIAYVFLSTRNKERMMLIEKGADASLFKSAPQSHNMFGLVILNLSLLAIGIGVGVFLGSLLEMGGMDDDVAYAAMIFICGGAGLLISFFVGRKLKLVNTDHH
ncbi:MAG: hypothetical protein HC819_21440 [Cyclobacteriaceae bacterium]|nr:hypothetical protein [Cyclobacteriaceae bacterium]